MPHRTSTAEPATSSSELPPAEPATVEPAAEPATIDPAAVAIEADVCLHPVSIVVALVFCYTFSFSYE